MRNILRRINSCPRASLLALAGLLSTILAAPLPAAVLIAPVAAQTPDTFAPCAGCTQLAYLSEVVTSSNGAYSFTLNTAVYSSPGNTFCAGCLTFAYQISNAATSTDTIGRVSISNFSSWQTDVGISTGGMPAAGGTAFPTGTDAPGFVDRNTDDAIGFQFSSTPFSNAIPPGDTSAVLVVDTNARNFTAGKVNVIDGSVTTVDAFQPAAPGAPNTSTGANVSVQPKDAGTNTAPVNLTFSNITTPGQTSVMISNTDPGLPTGFQLGNPPTFYNLSTTATFTPPIQVCINYAGISFTGSEFDIDFLHLESGTWTSRKISQNIVTKVICGSVSSLSPFALATHVSDTTPPIISATLTPPPNGAGWNNTSVGVSWNVADPESGIASSSGCGAVTLTAETPGTAVTCTASNGAGLPQTVTVRVKIDKTPPVVSGMPAPNCTLWPPDRRFVQVATVTATDTLSGLASFNVTATSNEPSDPSNPDIVIGGSGLQPRTVQLRADRLANGTGRIYTLTATAADLAGNSTTTTSTCTVPHDKGN